MDMDIVLFIIMGIISFIAGRNTAPRDVITVHKESTGQDNIEIEYLRNLKESLLEDVRSLRSENVKLKDQLWHLNQELKKLQQKS